MKYLLIALIITQSSGDHGPPITRKLDSYASMAECEYQSEFMRSVFVDGYTWMGPNSTPESIAYVRYVCKPVRE